MRVHLPADRLSHLIDGFLQPRGDAFHGPIVLYRRRLQGVETILEAVRPRQILKNPIALLTGGGGGDRKGRRRQIDAFQYPQK